MTRSAWLYAAALVVTFTGLGCVVVAYLLGMIGWPR